MKVPRKFVWMLLSKTSMSPFAIGESPMMPALFTTTSICPYCCLVDVNKFCTSSNFDMSAWIAVAVPPSPTISLTTSMP
jgi:hypothetical protein